MSDWTTTRTSADYTPAVAVWPDGRTRPCSVQAVRLDSVESARAKLAQGVAPVVAAGDAEKVTNGEAA